MCDEIISDESVCSDCYMALAYGVDDPNIDFSSQWCPRTFADSVRVLAEDGYGFELGSSDDGHFSWSSCMLCRGDAGHRYDVTMVSTRKQG